MHQAGLTKAESVKLHPSENYKQAKWERCACGEKEKPSWQLYPAFIPNETGRYVENTAQKSRSQGEDGLRAASLAITRGSVFSK